MLSCSERHPVNWSLGISSHLWKKTSKHSAFVDSVSPTVLFISLAITLGFIAAVCLLLLLLGPSWIFGSGYRSRRQHLQAAVMPLQNPVTSVFGWFSRLLLWWQVKVNQRALGFSTVNLGRFWQSPCQGQPQFGLCPWHSLGILGGFAGCPDIAAWPGAASRELGFYPNKYLSNQAAEEPIIKCSECRWVYEPTKLC